MNTFVRRLGVVFWWIGAALIAYGALVFVIGIIEIPFRGLAAGGEVVGYGAGSAALGFILLTVCFLCTGSFVRRPRLQ